MDLLKQIQFYSKNAPDRTAVRSGEEQLTYKELEEYSNRLSGYIMEKCGDNNTPIPVYGHKSVFMQVCFLACVKAGRAYCPLDISMPQKRTEEIIQMLNPPLVFAVEPLPLNCRAAAGIEEIRKAIESSSGEIDTVKAVKPEDTFYIIFTSGSTGTPKGVEITCANLNHYLSWSVELGSSIEEKTGKVFLNQAPFSFDLSVMDMYTCLASGGTLYSLSSEVQADFSKLLSALRESSLNIWVSTPSFAEMCMSLPEFNSGLLPDLKLFLFCGETLTVKTASKLQERFEDAKIINTYGPTESTVAVTEVLVTPQLLKEAALPVGCPKKGTIIEICREDGTTAAEGESGEIIILGDTVAKGYYKQKEMTEKAFFDTERSQQKVRGYRTGDTGYLKDGMLYFSARIDFQIKLNGFRIELGDIERNLLKLPGVCQSAVIPVVRENKVKYLTAYIAGSAGGEENKYADGLKIKRLLSELVPHYMVPKKIKFLPSLPMNNNGKIDRKKLEGIN